MSDVAPNPVAPEFEESPDDEILMLKRARRKGFGTIEGLNLTAMMDMMTILLVFLIKQYASAPENITLSDDLRPPASTTTETVIPSVQVMITRSAIMVEGKPIVKFVDGKPVAADGSAEPWKLLETALGNRVATIVALSERGGAKFDGNLMLVADQDTPYDTIWKVLYAAGQSKFTAYRLVLRSK